MAAAVGREQLDFRAEGTVHGSSDQAHEGVRGTAKKPVSPQLASEADFAFSARPHSNYCGSRQSDRGISASKR